MNYEELKKQIREKKEALSKGKNLREESLIEEDEYGIDELFQKIKFMTERAEPRLYKFMFKGTVDASIDARKYLNDIRKLCIELRGAILKQRQDNESDYS